MDAGHQDGTQAPQGGLSELRGHTRAAAAGHLLSMPHPLAADAYADAPMKRTMAGILGSARGAGGLMPRAPRSMLAATVTASAASLRVVAALLVPCVFYPEVAPRPGTNARPLLWAAAGIVASGRPAGPARLGSHTIAACGRKAGMGQGEITTTLTITINVTPAAEPTNVDRKLIPPPRPPVALPSSSTV